MTKVQRQRIEGESLTGAAIDVAGKLVAQDDSGQRRVGQCARFFRLPFREFLKHWAEPAADGCIHVLAGLEPLFRRKFTIPKVQHAPLPFRLHIRPPVISNSAANRLKPNALPRNNIQDM